MLGAPVRQKPNWLEMRFADVYRHALWGDEETRSGWGSKRESPHVQAALEYLRNIIRDYRIKTLSDIPCGDFNWQPLLFAEHGGLDYVGYDIVGGIVEDNRRKSPGVRFEKLDITKQIPRRADLILCKDMLNHLKYDDIRRAITNMKQSGSEYLLASNDFTWPENEDVADAGNNHRPVDICKPPLSYPAPIWNTHYMGLWRLAEMPEQAPTDPPRGDLWKRLRAFWDSRRRTAALRAQFTLVHKKNLWGSGESRSGWGSERGTSAVVIAEKAIEAAVANHGVRSINDIPCGDFNWMPDVLARLEPLSYRGFDIVKAVVARNKERHPDREFRLFDITVDVPPAADLIFCKDLFNHLRDEDVNRAIANMRRSGSTFLLASNNPGFANAPLPNAPGASRHLDITAAPFCYGAPLWTLDGYMSLWRLADMGECGF
jgi:trans-aconitate methyltransferase